MRNFSNDQPKNFVSEAPAFIQFFFDPARPKSLRIGAALVFAVIFFFPLFTANSSRKDKEPPKAAETPAAMVSEKAHDPVQVADPPVADSIPQDSLFNQVPGLFPVPIAVAESKTGTVWTTSVQDIYEFRGVAGTKKMDPAAYEGVFNNDAPPLTASYVDDDIVWTGSLNGEIMKYANYDWKIVWPTKEPIADRISALIRHDNTLYIGTIKGLWKWELMSGKLSRFKGFNDNSINAFLRTAKNDLYLASRNGVWQLTEQGWRQALVLESDRGALSLADDGAGGIWIGTDEGVRHLTPSGDAKLSMLRTSAVNALAVEKTGALWAGTNEGLRYYDGKQWFAATDKEKLPGTNVTQLLLEGKDNLWLGIAGKGVQLALRTKVEEWIRRFPFEDTPVDNDAPQLYKNACQAAETELKKATISGDVAIVRGKGTSMVFFRGKLVCPSMPGFRTADERVFVLKKNQLLELTDPKAQPIEIENDLVPLSIKHIFVDSKSRIWIGRDSGPAMYADNKWHDFSKDPAFTGNTVQAFAEDPGGGIWIGSAPPFNQSTQSYTQAALHRFDGENWAHFQIENGVPGYSVSALLMLADGRMAIGTPNGFAYMTTSGIVPASNAKDFKPGAIMSLNEDSDGRLWFGHLFFQKGLGWYHNGKLSFIEEPGKLFTDNFAAIVHDSKDRIWLMSTNGQIGVYSKEVLLKHEDVASAEGE